jgi:iron complex outermembrane receptor protein
MEKKLYFFICLLALAAGIQAQDTLKSVDINEVVIVGARTEVARNTQAPSISIIDKAVIESQPESNVLPILGERVPGMFVTERGVTGFGVAGGSAGQILIRGIGGSPNTQNLVLLDGHPQFMGLFGHPIPDAYVSSDVEKVEVIRGPASLMYGTNAMGGVINIINREQKEDGYRLGANASYGSYNTQKYMGRAGFRKNKFEVLATVNHDRTDGHRDNSDFRITNGYLKIGYAFSKKFRIRADLNIADLYTIDPGPVNTQDTTYKTNPHYADILRGRASISLQNSFEKADGGLILYYNFGDHEIYDGFRSTDDNYGINLYESIRVIKNNTTTIGFDYANYGGFAENVFDNGGEGIQFVDTAVFETGAYVLTQQNLIEKLTLSAGIRYHYHSTYNAKWVPQFGLTFRPKERCALKASIANGFRSPTIRELFMFLPANPNLEPEDVWNYEVSFSAQSANQKISGELALFYANGSNLIQVAGVFPDVQNINTGAFENYGLEASIDIRPIETLLIHTNNHS